MNYSGIKTCRRPIYDVSTVYPMNTWMDGWMMGFSGGVFVGLR